MVDCPTGSGFSSSHGPPAYSKRLVRLETNTGIAATARRKLSGHHTPTLNYRYFERLRSPGKGFFKLCRAIGNLINNSKGLGGETAFTLTDGTDEVLSGRPIHLGCPRDVNSLSVFFFSSKQVRFRCAGMESRPHSALFAGCTGKFPMFFHFGLLSRPIGLLPFLRAGARSSKAVSRAPRHEKSKGWRTLF